MKGLLNISLPNQDLTLELELASQITLILWGVRLAEKSSVLLGGNVEDDSMVLLYPPSFPPRQALE